ncbi:MAG: hypothetical protein ACI92S_002389 [Planctomycetaceae bacterium]|jgi:hypothetical protein
MDPRQVQFVGWRSSTYLTNVAETPSAVLPASNGDFDMNFLLVLALAGASPSSSSIEDIQVSSIAEAASELRPTLQTGTLLVSKGDCLAVRVYTQSPFTHVAAVVLRNGRPFVYDSTNGAGVRCQTLDNYLRTQSPDELHVFQPARSLNADRRKTLEGWLDGQLGRPYSVSHHLSGERGSGVHCAEYISEALGKCSVISVKNPAKVSPASLVKGITIHNVYSHAETIHVIAPTPEPTPPATWYGHAWQSTKTCTATCVSKFRRCVLCQ